jgi:hypothetical protein
MGSFNNNLTLGCVCNHCNSHVFNPLETRFKEDTEEGLFCQMVNFSDSHEVRIRNGNLKLSVDIGLGEPFFNETFPFLTFRDGGWKILFVPQIKIKGYAENGYIVLLVDKIKNLPRSGGKFRNLKKFLKWAESKNVSIFTHGEDDLERRDLNEAMDLVRELGINYKSGTEKSIPFVGDGSDNKKANVSVNVTIGFDAARIIAKIAFNYFAYCAIESEMENILHHKNFSKIKSYILGETEWPMKEMIIEKPTYNPILFEEKSGGVRFIAHIITIQNEDGNLVAKVSFAGRLVYKILLGKMPVEINKVDFGNGHIFDPHRKEIYGLTQNPAKRGTGDLKNFTLFNS